MGRCWFILQVKVGTEFSFLKSESPVVFSTDVYVPVVETITAHRRYKKVKKVSRKPAFAGYIFSELPVLTDWRTVKEDSRVFGPLSVEGEPFRVPLDLLDEVRRLERGNFEVDGSGPLPHLSIPIGEEALVSFRGTAVRLTVLAANERVVSLGVPRGTSTPLRMPTKEFLALRN